MMYNKTMKKTIIIFGSIFLVLVLSLIFITSVFKEEIKDEVLRYVNKNMDLEVIIEDYDLSIIPNFPRFTFSLEGVKVVDKSGFELVTIDEITTDIDSKNLIVDRSVSINSISIVRPVINYTLSGDSISVDNEEGVSVDSRINRSTTKVDNSIEKKGVIVKKDINLVVSEPESVANYEGGSKTISLNISSYEIVGASIILKDENDNDFVKITNLNHSGYGVFKNEILILNTVTFIEDIDVYQGKSLMLKNAQIKGDLSLELDLKNKIYSLKDNTLSVNKIALNWVGVIKEIEDSFDVDLRFDTPNTKFKDLLAMVPEDYRKDFENIETKGNFKIEGHVLGVYNKNTMPEFNLTTVIDNAYVKYPDLPESIDDINLVFKISKPQGNDFDKVSIEIPSASIKISDNKINAVLLANNLVSDPNLQVEILADFDLSKLRNAIPIDSDDDINGKIFADIFIKGKMSDIENENYNKFDARGNIKLTNFSFSTKSFKNKILINNADISITPKSLNLNTFDFKLGKSDVVAKGTISKYLEYILEDKELLGELVIKSNYFYANDFIPVDDDIVSNELTNSDNNTSTKVNDEEVDVKEQTNEQGKTVSVKQTKKATEKQEEDKMEDFVMDVIEIPANINFNNNISIKHFIYEKSKIDNLVGDLGIRNENAYLKNVKMETLEGKVLINGSYSSKVRKSPRMDFDLELKNIDIQKLSSTFNFIEQIAPIIENTTGKLSSKLDFRTSLDNTMNPIYETMFSKGEVFTKNVSLKNTDFINDFGEVLNVAELKNDPKIEDIAINYTITKGILTMAPFKVKIEDIESEFKGSSNVGDQTIDMDVSIIFPRKYLGKDTNAIIDNAVNLANTFGANVSIGKTIDVDAKIRGAITSPKYSLTYGEGKAETPEEYLKQQADKIIEDAKKDQGKDLEKKANDLLRSLFK